MKKSLLLVGAAMIGVSANAAVLWDNGHLDPDGYFSDAYSSGGAYWYAQSVADSFTLGVDSTIENIQFWGSSENFVSPDLDNMPNFEINIFDSSWNLVYSSSPATGSLTPTITGGVNGLGGNEYEMNFALSQALSAGTYYLNIGAVLTDGGLDAWAWSNGSNDGNLHLEFFDGFGFNEFAGAGDAAFVISGTPVPEPATMALLALGAGALAARRRKNA